MPNGLPNPKELLIAQAAVPKSIEASLPAGVPQVSSMLASIAASLPDVPALPAGIPGLALPTGLGLPTGIGPPVNIQNIFRSVEAALPTGVPKLAKLAGGTTIGIDAQPLPPARLTIGI